MNLLIIGHGRHGKDTVAELLAERLDLKIASSSHFIAEKVTYPALKDLYGYPDVEACFEDRHNHRAEWYNLIRDYNTPDLSRLAREIFAENDVYIGMRNKEELDACNEIRLFDIVVWVDAGDRLPPEPTDSMTITASDADYLICNNGTLSELSEMVDNLISYLKEKGIYKSN